MDPIMHQSFGAEMTVGPRGTGGGSLGGSRTYSNPPRTGSSPSNNNSKAGDLAGVDKKPLMGEYRTVSFKHK